jgi:hypothetical protein
MLSCSQGVGTSRQKSAHSRSDSGYAVRAHTSADCASTVDFGRLALMVSGIELAVRALREPLEPQKMQYRCPRQQVVPVPGFTLIVAVLTIPGPWTSSCRRPGSSWGGSVELRS